LSERGWAFLPSLETRSSSYAALRELMKESTGYSAASLAPRFRDLLAFSSTGFRNWPV